MKNVQKWRKASQEVTKVVCRFLNPLYVEESSVCPNVYPYFTRGLGVHKMAGDYQDHGFLVHDSVQFRMKLSDTSETLVPFYHIPEDPCLHYFNTDMYQTVHFAPSRGTSPRYGYQCVLVLCEQDRAIDFGPPGRLF